MLDQKQSLEASLLKFTKYIFNHHYAIEFREYPHHRKIINALQKVEQGKIKNLLINIPPRYGKTELAVKMFIAWTLAKNPSSKFIHTSYSNELAMDNSHEVKDIILSEAYQKFWPLKLEKNRRSSRKWFNQQKGGVYACSSGGQIVGFGAGMYQAKKFSGAMLVDDPLKPEDASSKRIRGKVNARFNRSILSRLNDSKTPIIVIMQRLHQQDLSGYLLKGGSGEKWHHLKIGAYNNKGHAICAAVLNKAKLKRIERADPYNFAAQYLQEPIKLGGAIFKEKWWQYYTVLPKLKWRAIYADTAQKTGQQNDYSVFQCWGYGVDNCAYLIDQIRGKWEAPELEKQAMLFWQKHKDVGQDGSRVRRFAVEDKISGTGLIQRLKRSGGVPIKAIGRSTDKTSRANDIVGYVASGYVYLPQESKFTSDILAEAASFPQGRHDDQIDPLIDAIDDMFNGKLLGDIKLPKFNFKIT